MQKNLFCILIFISLGVLSFGQGQNNTWCFGQGWGLDFNTTPVKVIVDSIDAREGCASVCDRYGHLLFYSGGTKVHDRTHALMPNGSGLEGDVSTTQGVTAASLYGQDSLYYLFTLSAYETSRGQLSYSIIDMRLNGGKGDVVDSLKNIFIDSSMSEKMIVAGCCKHQWLITHHKDSAIFYAYKIGDSTKIPRPVISKAGLQNYTHAYTVGEMKINKDNTLIAFACKSLWGLHLYDFDINTGLVNNYRIVDSTISSNLYNVEFSPDGSKLYVNHQLVTTRLENRLYQYDLSESTYPKILASRYTVYSDARYGLRAGPDGMLYLNTLYGRNFSRVKYPNDSGAACGFEYNFLPSDLVGPSTPTPLILSFGSSFSLPQLSVADTLFSAKNIAVCEGSTVKLTPSGHRNFFWNDGDTNAIKEVNSLTADYWVSAYGDCAIRVDTFHMQEKTKDYSFRIFDTSGCQSSYLTLKGRPMADSLLWHDGTHDTLKYLPVGTVTYWVKSFQKCSVSVDTYLVKENIPLKHTSYRDTLLCFGDYLTIQGRSGADSLLWFDGARDSSRSMLVTAANYWVKSYRNCEIFIDTVHVIPKTPVHHLIDTFVCPGNPIVLSARLPADSVLWFDGSRLSTNTFIAKAGKFWVRSTIGCTSVTDTFHLIEKSEIVAMSTQYLGICSGQVRQVYGKDEADHYLWSTGSTDKFIEVGSAGLYWVRSTKDCLVYIDTFIVDTIAYTILVVNADSFICPGEPLLLSGPPGYTRYLWSNGGTQQETNVFNEGKIILRAEQDSSCKWFTGEYSIAYIRFVKPLHDTFICNDEPVSVDAAVTFPQAVYAWSSGASTSDILINTPGRYIITVNAGNCRMSDSLSVTGKSLKVDIDESRTVCNGEVLILNVGLDNADYKWSTGDTKASIEISSPGLYSVVVSDGICSVKKEVAVSFVDCEHCVLFPNAFTPNNDGRNDYFKPILSCPIRAYELTVANRWGNVLFSSTDPNTGWNGMVNGRLLDPGVYYYFLKAAFDSQNTRVLKGDVTLIR